MLMKRWSIIIAVALIAIWLVVDTLREFFANHTIEYFTSEPHRLLYVAAIAIAGGFAALEFARLSVRTQRHIRVFAWGAAASMLTAFVGYFAFLLASHFAFIVESGGSAGVIAFLGHSSLSVVRVLPSVEDWNLTVTKWPVCQISSALGQDTI
jgi:hypothetical protein